uniref:Uncharacterized protein n=1 Tax=Manihot esculenta TaxID=3983 RepID=A0A2C9U8B4_MANES
MVLECGVAKLECGVATMESEVAALDRSCCALKVRRRGIARGLTVLLDGRSRASCWCYVVEKLRRKEGRDSR